MLMLYAKNQNDRMSDISSDQQIWNNFIAGDDHALALIYNSHSRELYRYGLKFSSNNSVIEDSIHDLFAELVKNRKQLGTTTNIRFYLLKSFKRKLFRLLQREKRFTLPGINPSYDFDVAFPVEEHIINEESYQNKIRALRKSIEKLTSRQKEAIYLRFNEELDYTEIAELLEMSIEASRNLIYRAVKELREAINTTGPTILLLSFFQKKFC